MCQLFGTSTGALPLDPISIPRPPIPPLFAYSKYTTEQKQVIGHVIGQLLNMIKPAVMRRSLPACHCLVSRLHLTDLFWSTFELQPTVLRLVLFTLCVIYPHVATVSAVCWVLSSQSAAGGVCHSRSITASSWRWMASDGSDWRCFMAKFALFILSD